MNHRDSPNIWEKLKRQRDANSKLYIAVPDMPLRTLLLMGPSRAGKSTISETLKDSLHEPNEPTLYSCTRNPDPKQINGLRIIDMPGFNDIQTRNKTSSLSNRSIVKMLQTQLIEKNPVHHIAFVFSLADGIKQEDINAMIFVQSTFPELAGRMMLVVTHAEELNHEEKDGLVEEFFQHPKVKEYHLRNFFKQGILFLGCLRYESYNRMDYIALRNEHQNVLEMRKKFIEKCFAEIPSTNNQQFNNSSSSSHFIQHAPSNFLKNCVASIIIALLCYVTCTALRPDSIPVTSTDPDNNLTLKADTTFNRTVENQTESYNTTESNEGLGRSEDDNLLALDSTFNATQTHASTLFELSQTTNEILKEILMEMKKLNQRFQNLEKTQEKFDRRLENIEYLLAAPKYKYST
jgi:GTP-binding protein EngB required for normal cell division